MKSTLIPKLSLAGLLLILLVPVARGQTAEDALLFVQQTPSTGARMMGLAGAGAAGLENQAAFVYNPAALGFYQHSEVAGSFNALAASDEAAFRIPGVDPARADDDVRDYGIGNLSYVYKLPTERGSFVLGAALNEVAAYGNKLSFAGTNANNSITDTFLPLSYRSDNGELVFGSDRQEIAYRSGAIEFREDFLDEGRYPYLQAVKPETALDQNGEVLEGGNRRELNIGSAMEVAHNVMAGLSVNVSFGSYEYDRYYEEVDRNNETTVNDYDVLLNDNSLLQGFEAFELEENFTSELTGVNLRGGLSGQVVEGMRAGLMLETPTFYSVEETYSQQMTTFFDEPRGEFLTYGGQDGDVGTGEFNYDITTPWRLRGGLAYTVGAATVTADAEFVDWSQMELEAESSPQYFETTNPVNSTIRDRFQAVVNGRFGLEYRFSKVSLRGGLAVQPDPVERQVQDEEGETLDRSKLHITAGLGYHFSPRLQLDMAWSMERTDDLYLPYGYYNDVEVPGEDVTITPPVIDEDITRNRFVIGLRYAF